jgi:hypothetical protein
LKKLIIIFILITSCIEEPVTVVYKIAAGSHYSTPQLFTNLNSNPLVFYAKFDSSAVSPSVDINKLYGFTDVNSLPHENSARFGWRWHNSNLEIFAYSYCDSKRSFVKIGEAVIGIWQRYEIEMDGSTYVYRFGNSEVKQKRSFSKVNRGVYTILQPYYGGDKPAPHNIYIGIRETI